MWGHPVGECVGSVLTQGGHLGAQLHQEGVTDARKEVEPDGSVRADASAPVLGPGHIERLSQAAPGTLRWSPGEVGGDGLWSLLAGTRAFL